MKTKNLTVLFLFFSFSVLLGQTTTDDDPQKTPGYLLGEEQQLEMIVHIWGEVKNPGEFRVPYNINVLELMSKAGGPTEYADISKVSITRESESWFLTQDALKTLVAESRAGRITEEKLDESLKTHFARRIMKYNVDKYLKDKQGLNPPPELQPGDVVVVPHNSWHRWREIVRVAHEVAVIASVYVWYLRSKND